MDINSELDVYKFLQLVNDDDGDDGTKLFIKHLFAIGKLEHVKALYKGEIDVSHNEDIAYLVALETVLEQFSEAFDMFIRENVNKEAPTSEARDIEAEAKRLIQEINYIINASITTSLSTMYQNITPHLYTSISCIDKLRGYKYINGVETNIKNALEFLLHKEDVSTSHSRGLYFHLVKVNI